MEACVVEFNPQWDSNLSHIRLAVIIQQRVASGLLMAIGDDSGVNNFNLIVWVASLSSGQPKQKSELHSGEQ